MKLDKNFIDFLEENKIKKIKIFFVEWGCSGSKIDVLFDDFDINSDLIELEKIKNTKIFVYKNQEEKFLNSQIIRAVKADHTGQEKVRFLFSNKETKNKSRKSKKSKTKF